MKRSPSQSAALEYIREYAKSRKFAATHTLSHILKMTNVSQDSFIQAVEHIKKYARVCLHFHPDRLDSQHISIAQALLEQGIYKSQFETFLSNGSVSAHPGGERDLWEKHLYGGAYHAEGSSLSDRPRYGALDLMRHPDGPAPRFGSCYFILKAEVSQTCTFTYLDSHHNPTEKGTLDELDDILAALFTEVFTRDFALGEAQLNIAKLVNLIVELNAPYKNPSGLAVKRNLDHYIEAQIHSVISLLNDVEMLVADPSFQDTETGYFLEQISRKYGIGLFWHAGFTLDLKEVPPNFRGPAMPSLAQRISTKNYLNAYMIGVAAESLQKNPDSWRDRGTQKEVLQELKLLWHVLVKFGKPSLSK